MLMAVSGVFISYSMLKALLNGTKLNAVLWGASSRYFFQYLYLFNMTVERDILFWLVAMYWLVVLSHVTYTKVMNALLLYLA